MLRVVKKPEDWINPVIGAFADSPGLNGHKPGND
jgi:hypothetical protein